MRHIAFLAIAAFLAGCAANAQQPATTAPAAPVKTECKLFTMGNQDMNFRSSGLSFSGGRGDGGSLGATLSDGWTPLNAVVVGNAAYMAACRAKVE